MTVEVADFLDSVLNPEGVAVVAEAYHLCMAMRGIKKAKAKMITSAMHGVFKEDERTRMEFLSFIGKPK
jgi:GTP cyclohydrolase I